MSVALQKTKAVITHSFTIFIHASPGQWFLSRILHVSLISPRKNADQFVALVIVLGVAIAIAIGGGLLD
jgi:hypothetical protein